MPWQYTPYTIALILAALVSGGLAIYVWQRRHAPGAVSIVVLMAAATVWSLAYALQLASRDLATQVFFAKIEYFGIVVIPVVGLIFALQYSGRGKWVRPRNIALLFVMPIITLALVWTNGAHELIWRNVRLESIDGFLVKVSDFGPWFFAYFAYAYVLMFIGTSLVVTILIASHDIYRRQAAALLIFALSPIACNALYVSGLNPLPHLDLTPFAFNISGLALAWGLFRFRLVDLIPVAYSRIIETMDDSVIVLDSQDRIIELNLAGRRLMGESSSNPIGQPLEEALPELAEKLDLSRLDPFNDDAVPRVEVMLGGSGSQRVYDAHISRSPDQLGRQTCKVIVLRETTRHIKAEKKIKEQKEFLEKVLESLTHPFYVIDANDYAIRLSNQMDEPTDGSESSRCYSVIHGNDVPCSSMGHPCPYEQVKKTNKPVSMEQVHCEEDGTEKHVQVYGYPVVGEDGNVEQVILYHLDITEQRQMEGALRESEARLRATIESLPFEFFIIDQDGRYVMQNSMCRTRWGDIMGKRPEELDVGEDTLKLWQSNNRRAFQGETIREDVIFTFDREERYYHNIISPILDQGKTKGILGVNIDLTERHKMEEEIRASEQRYRNIFENIQDVYGEVALDGTILEISPSIKEIGGYDREELLGKSILDYHLNPESRTEVISELFEKGRVKEWEFLLRHKDGQVLTFAFNVVLVTDQNGIPYKTVGVMRDITDRKRMEEELRTHRNELEDLVRERTSELQEANAHLVQEIAQRKEIENKLRQSEEKYRSIFEQAADSIVLIEKETGAITDFNDKAAENLGYTREEFHKLEMPDIEALESGEDIKRHRSLISAKSHDVFETKHRTKNGEIRDVLVNCRVVSIGDKEFFHSIWRDITERKQLEYQLRQSSKLASVGELATGVAHEINNPMAAIDVHAGLIRDIFEDAKERIDDSGLEEIYGSIATIEQQVERCRSITNNLLSFSRMPQDEWKSFGINELLTETTEMVSSMSLSDIDIQLNFDYELPSYWGSPNLLQQVFVNLLTNAFKATGKQGKIVISTNLERDGYIRIQFTDSGHGIPKDIRERIFDPFFTTSPEGEGTGLGLSISYYIIKQMNGEISADSAPGQGSTFTVILPVANETTNGASRVSAVAPPL